MPLLLCVLGEETDKIGIMYTTFDMCERILWVGKGI